MNSFSQQLLVDLFPANNLRPIGALWSLLSMVVGVLAVFCQLQPAWLIITNHGQQVWHEFGFAEHCIQYSDSRHMTSCRSYPYVGFLPTPTSVWSTAFLLYGAGAFLMFVAGVVSLATICCNTPLHQKCTGTIGKVQVVAATLLSFGLLTFSSRVDQPALPCHEPSALQSAASINQSMWFQFGRCQIGWTFTLAIMNTLLAFSCPMLAQQTLFGVIDLGHQGTPVPSSDDDANVRNVNDYYEPESSHSANSTDSSQHSIEDEQKPVDVTYMKHLIYMDSDELIANERQCRNSLGAIGEDHLRDGNDKEQEFLV